MEKKYKYYMLCRDLSKTAPFLRADGSPLITTAINKKEAWKKFQVFLEARLVSEDYLCEVELVPVRSAENSDNSDTSAPALDSRAELDTAFEGLKNVLKEQGRLANKNL